MILTNYKFVLNVLSLTQNSSFLRTYILMATKPILRIL